LKGKPPLSLVIEQVQSSAKRHGKPGVAKLYVTIVPKSTPENFETSIG
jgi:hypothetical protein